MDRDGGEREYILSCRYSGGYRIYKICSSLTKRPSRCKYIYIYVCVSSPPSETIRRESPLKEICLYIHNPISELDPRARFSSGYTQEYVQRYGEEDPIWD